MALIQFPYTNYHDINLDWLLAEMKELAERVAYIEEVLGIEHEEEETENDSEVL